MTTTTQPPLRHVMLDLETLSAMPNATIVSIGAVAFDADGVHQRFYTVVDLDSYEQLPHGKFHLSFAPIAWWFRQSKAARDEIGGKEKAVPIKVALRAFAAWLHAGEFEVAGVWGNGADFDNLILGNAYDALGILRPWIYSANYCMRTTKKLLTKIDLPRVGTHHNALDDAVWQAEYMIAAGLFQNQPKVQL